MEGKAKILLIVSIPQDVFIASGATVKPSLLFFKKFTEDEAATYSQIQSEAQITVTSKYQEEIDELQEKLKLRGNEAPSKEERKDYRAKLKALQEKIEMEVKAVVKEKFDYEIPIAEIQKLVSALRVQRLKTILFLWQRNIHLIVLKTIYGESR